MIKNITLLLLFVLSIKLSSQVTIQVNLKSISTVSNSDCDASAGDSDFGFEFRATDNSIVAKTNNNPINGLIGACNYAIINENNGPFIFSSPNAVFSPTTGIFFNHTYFCQSALPTQMTITTMAYENDDVSMPASSITLVEGPTSIVNTVITFSVPPISNVQTVTVN